MRYSLRQLEVFLAVARVGSVSGAGEALAMSQSAVSGALADLERQFGLQLFDRIGKRLRLSELGQSVRAQAEGVLDRASELEAAFEGRAAVGRLRIGATLTIGNHLVAPLMARFMREHSGAELTLAVANTEEIARRVANFDIDVGLVEGEIQHPDLEVMPWRDDELVVFCAPGHRYAKKRALTDADLRAARGSCASTAPARVRPSIARCTASSGSSTSSSPSSTPRRSAGPSWPASASGASRASPCRRRSSTAPSCPAACRTAISAGRFTSS